MTVTVSFTFVDLEPLSLCLTPVMTLPKITSTASWLHHGRNNLHFYEIVFFLIIVNDYRIKLILFKGFSVAGIVELHLSYHHVSTSIVTHHMIYVSVFRLRELILKN